MDNRPIGIFDSGLGGLTVLQEFLEQLPNEDYIYFGDNARVPYGSKSKETIIEYSREIINFLISKNVKMIVIACGTASANAFEILKDEFQTPIFSIIEPTAKKIIEKNVGVIATKSTIQSNAWENTINKYNPDCQLFSKACPLFVPIVEEHLVNTEISKLAIQMYLKDFYNLPIETLILGCTHYPILMKEIKDFLPTHINLINANIAIVQEVKEFLKKNNSLNFTKKMPEVFAYTTDDSDTFSVAAKNFCHINFHKIEKVTLK